MGIDVRSVGFSYGTQQILKNISFTVTQGCLLCVLGPNGVGKSTLFRCMLGLLKNFNGTILIDGEDNKKLKVEDMAQKIAYVPQTHSSVFPYTVIDMVLMGTTARLGRKALPGTEQYEQAMEALNRLNISKLANRSYTQISGGEAQLVLISRAIAQQAKILVMDEPTSNLDYGNQIHVMDEVKKLAQNGYTIIQSTHSPQQAFLYADKVLVLLNGTAAKTGTPKDVLNEEMLFNIYGVHVKLHDLCNGSLRVCVPDNK